MTERNPNQPDLKALEVKLQHLIQRDESVYLNERLKQADSLWGHSIRVATMAEKIGILEGADQYACRLAGLFHDAGKFANGEYHPSRTKEEDGSVRILYEMTQHTDIQRDLVDEVAEAILQIYEHVEEPSLLAKILFDADNLDKLGLSGVGNFLIKAGLRGRGLTPVLLYRISAELTYARYATETMMTSTGKQLAIEKAPETTDFFHRLLHSLRQDSPFDFHVTEVEYGGMVLDIVESSACACGGATERKIWEDPGLKCLQIHVEHRCGHCGFSNELQFCRPRLA